MTKAAVTGATGFLGYNLVKRLLADGHQVHAHARDPAKAETLPEGVSVFLGDICDEQVLTDTFAGFPLPDVVEYHWS